MCAGDTPTLRLALDTSIVTVTILEIIENEGEYLCGKMTQALMKLLQALEILLVTLMMAGVSQAQKGGAKGAMRNKGGRSGGGGRGGGGGTRHMEEFEDSEYYVYYITIIARHIFFKFLASLIIMTTANQDHVLACVISSEII